MILPLNMMGTICVLYLIIIIKLEEWSNLLYKTRQNPQTCVLPHLAVFSPIHWGQMLSREWRCSWRNAMLQLHLSDQQFITYWGATYISYFVLRLGHETMFVFLYSYGDVRFISIYIPDLADQRKGDPDTDLIMYKAISQCWYWVQIRVYTFTVRLRPIPEMWQ